MNMSASHLKALQAARGEVVSLIADGFVRLYESKLNKSMWCVSLRHSRNGNRVRVVVVEDMMQIFSNGTLKKTQYFH